MIRRSSRERSGWLRRGVRWPREKARGPAPRDANTERRGLPMVKIDKEYVFEGPRPSSVSTSSRAAASSSCSTSCSIPTWDAGCPSCTAGSDEISAGLLRQGRVS